MIDLPTAARCLSMTIMNYNREQKITWSRKAGKSKVIDDIH
jgi:hypothetical protein